MFSTHITNPKGMVDVGRTLQPEFPEWFAFLTQLPRQAHPILPSQVELVFPRAESGKDDGANSTDALGWKFNHVADPTVCLANRIVRVCGLGRPDQGAVLHAIHRCGHI